MEDLREVDSVLLDSEAVHAFRLACAQHEAWFQSGAADAEAYEWPVPGTRAMANEGPDAYFAYRDYIAGFMLVTDGFGDMFADLKSAVSDIEQLHPGAVRRLVRDVAPPDDAFRSQWNNLFAGGPEWLGLTHESLGLYVRKYEVEWPLRILACLRELLSKGTYDTKLTRFRDRAGRLKKGVVVDYVTSGFTGYPALRDALALGYSPDLRNLVGHNEYVIEEDRIRSLDGTYSQMSDDLFRRMVALSAIHNGLVWLSSTALHDDVTLAPRGVIGLGWLPLAKDGMPRLLVLQLAAFRQYDTNAAWLDSATLTIAGERLDTKLGAARSWGGPIPGNLAAVLEHLREVQRLECEVVGVMPCLHAADVDHAVFELADGRFCEIGEPPVLRIVPVTFQEVSTGEERAAD